MGRLNRSAPMRKVIRLEDGSFTVNKRSDNVTAEEPLQIRMGGQTITTTMRTPGHDLELTHGFLHSEGLIKSAEDVVNARYCAGAVGPNGENTYNTLDVQQSLFVKAPTLDNLRLTTTNSACGVCGSTSIETIMDKRYREITPVKLKPELILQLPQKLRENQKMFKKTGGIHAAAAFESDGTHLVTREDIGRHNAADKVIGHLMLEDTLDKPGRILVMSSRASFELVQKAIMAGFSALIAVSAASSLAIELAEEAGLTLVAFARDDRFNIYSGELDLD
ncbi:formate dehydrogenase accessory sulfurtransferase FdhD [Rothia aerolata]|uniref:Sulfur carrier protein FdhD n=1 Tax=Rothia aerolata TaxID=1812262 RepID=A0A917IV56_9MICC|nr:formate dehydrogenase accessory sulfurtransferase FdhD [Rothia aerolata]GGH63978.1 sulfurtransferase FdhD [Rothia aerolata]